MTSGASKTSRASILEKAHDLAVKGTLLHPGLETFPPIVMFLLHLTTFASADWTSDMIPIL
jgi:hypothetical protein